jgi:hypothetical protein
MSLLGILAVEYVVLDEVGTVQLPRVGTTVRVRVMDSEHGPPVDVREWWTEDRWRKVREARAAAAHGPRLGRLRRSTLCPCSADKKRTARQPEASASSRTVVNFPTWTENAASTARTSAAIASTFAMMVDLLRPGGWS